MSLNSKEEQKQLELTPEEIEVKKRDAELFFENLLSNLQQQVENSSQFESKLIEILADFENFLTEKPAPPEAWVKLVGKDLHKYDYHQVVLPNELCDPYEEELENIERIRKFWGNQPFMALEAQLLLSNKNIYNDGHYPHKYSPKPILILESIEDNQEVDWDCCLIFYPDGSYWSYNLEKDDDEDLGTNGAEILIQHQEILSHLKLRIPTEGLDYGMLTQ